MFGSINSKDTGVKIQKGTRSDAAIVLGPNVTRSVVVKQI